MMPAVPVPESAGIRTPIEVKLKPHYRYNPARRLFETAAGKNFKPAGDLPRNTRLVYKVPALAQADPLKLSKAERDLRRFMQVILPEGASAADYVAVVRAWPSVEDAWVAPQFSLPSRF
jgi:hypothetical protein